MDSMEDEGATANRGDDHADAAALARYANDLLDGMLAALPGWSERRVVEILVMARGTVTGDERAAAVEAGERAQASVGPVLRALLIQDIDAQRSTPLDVVRRAVPFPTEVLRAAGVPPVSRDEFDRQRFPDDDYDLSPRTYEDLDPALREVGLTWGAAKAHVHLQRRRRRDSR
jgi:hypothetical protein